MRFRLALAFFISVLLIGIASWSRVTTDKKTPANLIAVMQAPTELDNLEYGFDDFIGSKATTTAPVDTSLSNTDILTRNLVLNYLDASASGNGVVSPSTLEAIAAQQVNEIGKLNTFKRARIQDIQIIADTKATAVNYANEFSKIYSNYQWEITLVTDNAKSMASLYDKMSSALKALPVPVSVSSLHLELINNHASTAAALRSLENAEADPVLAAAGIAAIRENVSRETLTLSQISRILREKYAAI